MLAILVVGEDAALLSTRAAVLRGAGAEVVCTDAEHAEEMLKSVRFDLVAICHTLHEKDGRRVLAAARRSSGTKVLLVDAVSERNWSYLGSDCDARVDANPEGLVRKAIELLEGVAKAPVREWDGSKRVWFSRPLAS